MVPGLHGVDAVELGCGWRRRYGDGLNGAVSVKIRNVVPGEIVQVIVAFNRVMAANDCWDRKAEPGGTGPDLDRNRGQPGRRDRLGLEAENRQIKRAGMRINNKPLESRIGSIPVQNRDSESAAIRLTVEPSATTGNQVVDGKRQFSRGLCEFKHAWVADRAGGAGQWQARGGVIQIKSKRGTVAGHCPGQATRIRSIERGVEGERGVGHRAATLQDVG